MIKLDAYRAEMVHTLPSASVIVGIFAAWTSLVKKRVRHSTWPF